MIHQGQTEERGSGVNWVTFLPHFFAVKSCKEKWAHNDLCALVSAIICQKDIIVQPPVKFLNPPLSMHAQTMTLYGGGCKVLR